jgi:hypothetical protein
MASSLMESRLGNLSNRKLMILAAGVLVNLWIPGVLHAEESSSTSVPFSLRAVVAEFQGALRIPNPIEILIVEENDLLVSVSHDSLDSKRFRMSFERSFLQPMNLGISGFSPITHISRRKNSRMKSPPGWCVGRN